MAKILTSPLISDIRKKVGGVVFQNGRTHLIVRKKVSPIQPRTTAQRAVRANFTSNSKSWGATLTQPQRASFITLGGQITKKDRLGQSFKQTGLQLYQSLNRNLNLAGVAGIVTAPAALSVGFPGATTLVANETGTPAMTVATATAPAAAEVPIIFAAGPISPGRVSAGKKFTFLFKAAAGVAGPYNILAAYTAKYGTLVTGQNVQVEAEFVNNITGAASQKIAAATFVT